MSVEPEAITAGASLLSALGASVVAVYGVRTYYRRRAQRQADADAAATEVATAASEATTFKAVDEVARGWIKLLKGERDEVRARLGMEVDNKRVLLDHVDVLEDHINDGKPPPLHQGHRCDGGILRRRARMQTRTCSPCRAARPRPTD